MTVGYWSPTMITLRNIGEENEDNKASVQRKKYIKKKLKKLKSRQNKKTTPSTYFSKLSGKSSVR